MILEPDVVLILVHGQQIHQPGGQQQPARGLTGAERDKAERQNHLQDVNELFPSVFRCGEQLGQQVAGVYQRRAHGAQQTLAAVRNQIVEAVDHGSRDGWIGFHAETGVVFRPVRACFGQDQHGDAEPKNCHDRHNGAMQARPPRQNEVQRKQQQINRGVLLDHEEQHRADIQRYGLLFLKAPEQPQEYGREEAVLVQIVKTAACQGGEERVDEADQHGCLAAQLVMAAEQQYRNHAACNQYSLRNLQGHGRGEQSVEGKNQVVDGRQVYHEVRQENIALTGDERQSLDLHVVEHLAEQTEIKVGRGEGGIAQAGDARNNAAADQSAYHREGCDGALAGLPFVQQEMVYPEEVNEKEGVGDQHRQQEQEFILSFLAVICQPPGNADRCAKQKEPRVCFQRGQQCGDYREQGKIQRDTAQQESGRNVRAKGGERCEERFLTASCHQDERRKQAPRRQDAADDALPPESRLQSVPEHGQ